MSLLIYLILILLPAAVLLRDWKYPDRRTRRHHSITRVLLLLWLAAGIGSTYLAWSKDKESESLQTRLDDILTSNEELHRQNTQLTLELGELSDKLEPFIQLAEDRYPDDDMDAALQNLRTELADIRDLASRDVACDPSEQVMEITSHALTGWQKHYPDLHIELSIRNIDRPNVVHVGNNVYNLLSLAGIEVRRGVISHFTPGRAAAIVVEATRANSEPGQALAGALANYVTGSTVIQEDSTLAYDCIRLSLDGWPKFSASGQIQLE